MERSWINPVIVRMLSIHNIKTTSQKIHPYRIPSNVIYTITIGTIAEILVSHKIAKVIAAYGIGT